VLVPCSAVAYFGLARRRRRAFSLAALTGATDPGEGQLKPIVSPQCGFPRASFRARTSFLDEETISRFRPLFLQQIVGYISKLLSCQSN
jgi:hypothetical protein